MNIKGNELFKQYRNGNLVVNDEELNNGEGDIRPHNLRDNVIRDFLHDLRSKDSGDQQKMLALNSLYNMGVLELINDDQKDYK